MNCKTYDTISPIEGNHCCNAGKTGICWGSIFAGSVSTFVAQICFGILGIAIGASTIDPLKEANPTNGLGMGGVVWWLITGTISLYLGGWIAGKVSGPDSSTSHKGFCRGSIHGFVTWGLVTLLTFYFITSTLGSAIGGATSVLGKGLGFAGKAVSQSAPEAKNAAEEFMKSQGIDVPNFNISNLKTEAENLLRDTQTPALQPEQLRAQGNQASQEAQKAGTQVINNPANTDQDFRMLFDKLYSRAEGTADAADKEALINIVAKRKNVSKEEAARIVDNWEQAYNQAKAKFQEAKNIAEQKTREAADKVMEVTSKSAFSLFFMLLLGAIAASVGGRMGSCCNKNTLHITK